MSYLDEWLKAWKSVSSDAKVFNVLKNYEIINLQKSISRFDLIVILHSVSADSNKWLKDLQSPLSERSCPVILFVGNEYSNPWLSMESRLQHIAEIKPELIATQLIQESGDFLYSATGATIVEIPHALPSREFSAIPPQIRKMELGFRGFDYPWFLLDSDRNSIVDEVSNYYLSCDLSTDISKTERLDKESWYKFLKSCKTTVASEGGSNYVFKTDDVWREALSYLESVSGHRYLKNDFIGAKFLRLLPGNLKTNLRRIAKIFGKEQGAMSILAPEILENVMAKIDKETYTYVSGKALTSRHMDAIYCGTWQILSPGSYNGVLNPGIHYSVWDGSNPEAVLREVNEAVHAKKPSDIYDQLIQENSYQSRINKLLDRLQL
jgi:hypothetical protein